MASLSSFVRSLVESVDITTSDGSVSEISNFIPDLSSWSTIFFPISAILIQKDTTTSFPYTRSVHRNI